ncbi:MAG: aldehyde dehydrogenase [Pseudomonadota bacterium]
MTEQSKIDALRAQAVPAQGHWINGARALGNTSMAVISPIDGQQITTITDGTAADVDRAVANAKTAFDDRRWAGMPPAARKTVMHRWADLIADNALELAVLGIRDNGTEFGMAIKAEPGSAAATIRYYAEAIDKVYGEIAPTAETHLGLVHREPVGVVGAIVPWNFPLMIGTWKLGPALAAGNSVVLKPGETASLSLLRLAELASEAGLPDGVLNVVTGNGAVVGEALALHPDVSTIAFTGSGATGRRLLEYSARSNLKRCFLELGGKSANVVFADSNLDKAAKVAAGGIFRNSGQVCVAGSRLLVEATVADDFTARVAEHAEAFRVGDPLDLATHIGAVHSERELQKNLGFVTDATEEGATLVTGGNRILAETGGTYMQPTVFKGVTPNHRLFREEAFGPILAVTPFESEAEAMALANATDYGLAGAVWTRDLSRAHRCIRAMRTGVVHVNCYGGPDITVPLAGVGQSGNGADKSLHALDKYTDLKTAWIEL